MNLPTLVQLAKGIAEFTRYEDGRLWYQIPWDDNGATQWFEFPIPTDAPDLAFEVSDAIADLVYTDGENVVAVRTRVYAALDAQRKRGAGAGRFGAVERAVTFLRWIRPHLEMLQGAVSAETSCV